MSSSEGFPIAPRPPLRSGKDDEDLPIATEPVVSEDPGQFGDVILNGENDLPDPDEVLDLLGNVYEALKDLCERILAVVGRG